MNKQCTCGEVKRAMEKSIAKWERVVNQGVDGCGVKECGLCDLFNYGKYSSLCEGCPVSVHTGRRLCANTPYDNYERAITVRGERNAAKKELDFLKMLYHKYFVKGVPL